MIENFLKQLGASTKIMVGVSISPGIGLEMIEVDRTTKTVNKYAYRPLEYNYSTREIVDYAKFQEALEALFVELGVPKKSNVVLNIPNVHFGTITLPLLLTDDAITNAIVSEVEQSYIFKRQEPAISWMESNSNIDTESRSLVYTAVQQTALDGFKAACQEVGCTLIAVETSYASFLKALYYTDIAKDQLKDNVTWNLMVIGQNNYSIFSMVGKKIVEYYEEPLALKSFVDDEIYNAISSSAQLTLVGLPANYLFIASETDLVSAEVLSMKIPFEGQVRFLECNKYAQSELAAVNLNILPNVAVKMTPEAVGVGIYSFCDFPIKFNLGGEIGAGSTDELEGGKILKVNIGNQEFELTPDLTKKLALILGGVILIPLLILTFFINGMVTSEQTKLDSLNQKITQTNEEIKKYTGNGANGVFDVNTAIDKISSQNRAALLYYSALRVGTPSKLWITYYMTNSAKKVDIKGKSSDVESVYTFYKNLKQLITNSDIRLYKLEIVSESLDNVVDSITDGPRYYEFEITNMTAEELNPPALTGKEGEAAQPEEKKSIFGIGKSLFGPKQEPTGTGTAQPGAGTPPAQPVVNPPPAAPSGPSSPPAPQTGKGDQLPKNLQSIEKF